MWLAVAFSVVHKRIQKKFLNLKVVQNCVMLHFLIELLALDKVYLHTNHYIKILSVCQ